jgi:hypothetical protein
MAAGSLTLNGRRLDRRGKLILTIALVTALIANGGAAWAYWTLHGQGSGVAVAGTATELTMRGQSDDSRPLYPGGTTNLTVTVANQNDFPVKITSVSLGPGRVTADLEHRHAGCRHPGVAITGDPLQVTWNIPKNTTGVFTVPDGLAMNNSSDTACQGAVFAIPVRAIAVSNA